MPDIKYQILETGEMIYGSCLEDSFRGLSWICLTTNRIFKYHRSALLSPFGNVPPAIFVSAGTFWDCAGVRESFKFNGFLSLYDLKAT